MFIYASTFDSIVCENMFVNFICGSSTSPPFTIAFWGFIKNSFFVFFFRYTAQRSAWNQPGRCGAQMLLAQGEKELILVALLDEMVMSCSFEDSFVLD